MVVNLFTLKSKANRYNKKTNKSKQFILYLKLNSVLKDDKKTDCCYFPYKYIFSANKFTTNKTKLK